MKYPETFQNIIDMLKLLPGVGEKTAERYAFSLMEMDDIKLEKFGELLCEMKKNITTCNNCGTLCESNKCLFCEDETRNKNIICVVENKKNVFILEKTGVFKTKYHVLGGLISPMEGVNPEDLSIEKLLNRIEKENIEELILALRPGIEGNTTALYIKKILKDKKIKVTQIAQGVPIGADMEYLDSLTLELALENRSELV